MNITSKTVYHRITLTFPEILIVQLKTIPKGKRSGLVADAVWNELKRWKRKDVIADLRKNPINIRVNLGGWRETQPLEF